MTAKVFEHPFDLTKVRLQSQVLDSTARFSGPLDCLTQTWKKEGVRGLYRVRGSHYFGGWSLRLRLNLSSQGLPAPIVGAMAENASLFLSYNEFQNVIRSYTGQPLSQELSLGQLAIAAAGAGAVTSFFLYVAPLEQAGSHD